MTSCQTSFELEEEMAMDSTSTYLFRGMGESQMRKILAAGKEITMKKGQQIIRE